MSLISWYTYAQDFFDYIKTNYEYIQLQDQIFSNEPYVSNKDNTYYFLWSVSLYEISDFQSYYNINRFLGFDSNTFFVKIENEDKFYVLQKKENIADSWNCENLDNIPNEFLSNHTDLIKIDNDNTVLLWKNKTDKTCFSKDWVVFLPKNDFVDYDIQYFRENYSQINDVIDKINSKISPDNQNDDTIKLIYDYIIENTSYNYDVVEDLNNLPNDMYPWRIWWFFDWLNVVCDWYVKVFVFLAGIMWLEAERVVGEVQPIVKNELDLEEYLHSWIKIEDKYYDPTFDDTENPNWYNYFWKSKKCFNINHYKDWWINFSNYDERFEYLKNNADYIISNCPWILVSALVNDWNLNKFLTYVVKEKSSNKIEKIFCYMWVCDIQFDNLESKKWKQISYTIWSEKEVVEVYQILKNFEMDNEEDVENQETLEESKKLSSDEKRRVELVYEKIDEELLSSNTILRERQINNITNQLDDIIERDDIWDKPKRRIKYLKDLFLVEK